MANSLRIEVLLSAIDKATKPFQNVTNAAGTAAEAVRKSKIALRDLGNEKQSISNFAKLRREMRDTVPALEKLQTRAAVMRITLDAQTSAHHQLGGELKAEKRAVEANASALRKATTVSGEAIKTQKLREQGLVQLQTRYAQSSEGLRDAKRTMRAANSAVLKMTAGQAKLNERLASAKQKLEATGLSTDKFGSRQRALRAEIGRVTDAMRQQEKRAKSLARAQEVASKLKSGGMSKFMHGSAMALGGMGALRVGALPVMEAVEFESAMADVKKVVNFDTPQQFKQMGNDIQQLSLRVPMASEEIAKMVAFGGQALGQNTSKSELIQFAEDAAKMGVAFDMSAEDAGQTMATWRTAFRMGQGDAVKLADQVNYLGNTGPANAEKITAIINRVGALGDVAGLQAAPLAALGATVSGMGVEDEVAATGIKNLLLRLTAGTSATARQRVAFKALGLDAAKVAKGMQVDAKGTILSVLERIQKMPKNMQAATLGQLFGTESVTAIAPLLTNLELVRENLNKVTDAQRYGGSMQAEYASRSETSANKLVLLKNSAKVLGQKLGDTLLPLLTQLSDLATKVVGKLSKWAEKHPQLAKGMMLAVIAGAALFATLGVGIAIFGVLAMGLGHIISLFTVLRGLGLGGKALSGVGKLGGVFKTVGRVAGRALLGIGRFAMMAGRAVLASPLGIAIGLLALAAYMVWKNWDGIKAGAIQLWKDICAGVSAAWDWLKGKMLALWEGLSALWARFKEMGSHLLHGLVDGLLGALTAVKDTITNIGGKVVGWLKEKLGIHSPSRVFAQLGTYTMAGFTQGLLGGEGGAQAALGRIGNNLRKTGAGIAIGSTLAVGSAMAATIDHRPPLATGRRGGGMNAATYNITINAAGSQNAQDIAALVRQEIERIEHARRVRTRSELSDYE